MTYELRRVSSADDWDAYHSLRETVLWSRREDLPPYDREHPDERADGHYPFLFVVDDEPVGTIRVDLAPPTAWLRLVAVREDRQRSGIGRRLLEEATEFARARGCVEVRCNVEADAIGFYQKFGFTPIEGSALNLIKWI